MLLSSILAFNSCQFLLSAPSRRWVAGPLAGEEAAMLSHRDSEDRAWHLTQLGLQCPQPGKGALFPLEPLEFLLEFFSFFHILSLLPV